MNSLPPIALLLGVLALLLLFLIPYTRRILLAAFNLLPALALVALGSLDWLLRPQLEAFARAGYDVVGVSAPGPHVAPLEAAGIRHVAVPSLTRAIAPKTETAAFGDGGVASPPRKTASGNVPSVLSLQQKQPPPPSAPSAPSRAPASRGSRRESEESG